MQKKFEINRTKIKGGFQLGRKVVPPDSKSDLLLELKMSIQRKQTLDERDHREKKHQGKEASRKRDKN